MRRGCRRGFGRPAVTGGLGEVQELEFGGKRRGCLLGGIVVVLAIVGGCRVYSFRDL